MTRRCLVGLLVLAACGSDTGGLGGEIDAASSRPDARVTGSTPDAAPAVDAPLAVDAAPAVDAPPAIDARTVDAGPAADARTVDAAPAADALQFDAGPVVDAGPLGCFTAPGVQTVTTSTVFTFENYNGARNDYVFNSNQCSDPPDSVERIFTFDLDHPTEWYTETRCGVSSSWDCELVLTRNGCTDADVVNCSTTIGDEAMGGTLPAGKYALFVEGDNPEDPSIFDLMVNFNHTEGQAQCAAKAISVIDPANCEDPFFDSPNYHVILSNEQTTPSDIDDFYVQDVDGCTHDQDHIGGAPDKVYTLTLPAKREVAITLDPIGGWDAMLYVTGSPCGARSQVLACSDDAIGNTEEVGLTLDAGTWYIVVDGFGEETFGANSWGDFDLDVKVYDDACNE